MRLKWMKDFLQKESAGGVVLIVAAIFALILDNSPLAPVYQAALHLPLVFNVRDWQVSGSLLFLINEGLMSLFFVLVGLELKREFLEGELSQPSRIILPSIAAFGGMLMPALIYAAVNYPNAVNLQGWAVPVATDIAFALGVLSLLGKRIPVQLKIFLMTLAIFDDVGAIVIIAVAHSHTLSGMAMLLASVSLLVLWLLNFFRIRTFAFYLAAGLCLWFSVLQSGVHATIAGILFALMIPMELLHPLEEKLHSWVAFLILPLFALANAGVSFRGDWMLALLHPITVGVVLGLFIGKQLGVFGFTWLSVKFGWAKLPREITWLSLYGMSVLCGIGFTMSLFLGTLAFEQNYPENLMCVRVGVLLGSLLSGVVGIIILRCTTIRK